MIAILIFGIIMTTVFASYRSVFFSADKIDDALDLYGMVGGCLDRISVDLGGIAVIQPPEYAKPEFNSTPDPYRVVGDRSEVAGADFPRLRLVSESHVPLDGSLQEGIAEIVYYVSEDKDNGYVLRRSDRLYAYPPPEEQADDPVLCDQLKSLVITYYDKEGTAYESWDSESGDTAYAIPKAINIL